MSALPQNTPCWIEWITENRKGKKVKTPVDASGRRLNVYDKRRFRTRDKLPAKAKPGFVLGLDGDSTIIGLDLDTCRDLKTGKLTPWAREALDVWGSYAEISPSETGVKAYARVSAATFKKLRKLLDGRLRRTWAIGAGEHPPGIMLALGGYFAVTDDPVSKAGLSEIDAATVQKVMDIGARIERKAKREAGVDESSGWNDETGSGESWRLAIETRREGGSFEDFAHAVDDNPEALRSCEESPRGLDGQLERDWERACDKVDRDDSKLADKFDDESDDDKPKKRSTLEIFWGDEDDGTADLELLVHGVLHKRTLASIYGVYGAGKSFVALDLALCVATGTPWFGNDVTRGAVLYVAPEGYAGLKRRRAAWVKHHKLKGTPENFALVRGSLNLQRPDKVTVESLAAEAKERGALLIVIDTLNASFGGADENDSAAMSKARHELERLRDLSGAAVLVVHHAGKDISRGLRGSSVLGGALDTVLLVHEGRIIARPPAGKQKDLEAGDDIGFKLENVDLPKGPKGEAISSAVVVAGVVDKFEDDTLTESEKAALALLTQRARHASLIGPMTGVEARELLKRKDWRHKPGADAAALKKARQRVLESLEKKGAIDIDSNDDLRLCG